MSLVEGCPFFRVLLYIRKHVPQHADGHFDLVSNQVIVGQEFIDGVYVLGLLVAGVDFVVSVRERTQWKAGRSREPVLRRYVGHKAVLLRVRQLYLLLDGGHTLRDLLKLYWTGPLWLLHADHRDVLIFFGVDLVNFSCYALLLLDHFTDFVVFQLQLDLQGLNGLVLDCYLMAEQHLG